MQQLQMTGLESTTEAYAWFCDAHRPDRFYRAMMKNGRCAKCLGFDLVFKYEVEELSVNEI